MKTFRLAPLLFVSLLACNKSEISETDYSAFVGATIIDGNGGEPIRNGVMLLQHGRVVNVGTQETVTIPQQARIIDVSGKTIIPGIINSHGHVGDVKGIEGGHYSTENAIDNLKLYARYGITTVVSLGGDKKEVESLRHVHDTTDIDRARLFIAGDVVTGNTIPEALAVVDRNDHLGVDIIKIRVDDQLGTAQKMPEEMYRAIIGRSHELGYKVAAHMYYLDDAKKLLDAGVEILAHSVRDKPVDEGFVKLLKEKKTFYCPTLTREFSTYVYGDTAEFFSDPFFKKEYDSTILVPLLNPARQQEIRNSKSAITYKQQLTVAMANLKTLSDQGVPIVSGTDSGIPARFIGYFEHLEMKMMADAGLTPMQIIVAATKNAAAYLDLKDLGTLTPGYWADFLVLDANPLDDIQNTRKISGVFIGAKEIPGKR